MLTKLHSLATEIVPAQVSGNVSIAPSAVIAPGVLLIATANSQIAIGAGVCIGAGTIVRATGGKLEIDAGACLGREVLVVGSGKIGRDACIGAGTTTIDPQIAEGAVIPPYSLLGDRSRGDSSPAAVAPEDIWSDPPVTTSGYPLFYKVKSPSSDRPDPPDREPVVPTPAPQRVTETTAIAHTATNYVSGRAQFERIKRALFPNSGSNDDTAQT